MMESTAPSRTVVGGVEEEDVGAAAKTRKMMNRGNLCPPSFRAFGESVGIFFAPEMDLKKKML
jgi:hypothetical protein